MSLGLMTFIEVDGMRFAELGRREAESVDGGGEELHQTVSEEGRAAKSRPRRPNRMHVHHPCGGLEGLRVCWCRHVWLASKGELQRGAEGSFEGHYWDCDVRCRATSTL